MSRHTPFDCNFMNQMIYDGLAAGKALAQKGPPSHRPASFVTRTAFDPAADKAFLARLDANLGPMVEDCLKVGKPDRS